MTATRAVELSVAGAAVFGELTQVEGAPGTVLLLHDQGGDLDSVRPFARALGTLLLDTLLVDLPGHGLSGGSWSADAGGAVRQALDLAARPGRPVGVVAVGAACALLLQQSAASVAAVALVSPRLTTAQLLAAEPWRSVPHVAFGDPCDLPVEASLQELGRWTRAWCMRVNVHRHEVSGLSRPTPHMTHASAAFIAEQIAYLSHPRAEVARAERRRPDRPVIAGES